MPKCKTCGETVTAGPVFHGHCLEELAERICEEYCRWPQECKEQDELDEKCEACPLNRLVEG